MAWSIFHMFHQQQQQYMYLIKMFSQWFSIIIVIIIRSNGK